VLAEVPETVNAKVLVGRSTSDDAGVYLLTEDTALVQTVDFFTPILDDPYQFGRIAAANSLSDVYAMNAAPITALNIMGFPEGKLPLSMMAEILRGGAAVAAEAGVAILGGHTVKDNEPKYGLSVTGVANPRNIWRNVGAHPGDALVLTKPIGVGVLATAAKKTEDNARILEDIVSVTTALNAGARDAAAGLDVHACTDVTGFGLLGHLREMVGGSEVGAIVRAGDVPIMRGVLDFIGQGIIPNTTKRNLDAGLAGIEFDDDVPREMRLALIDSMTSGGLLFALPADQAGTLVANLKKFQTPAWAVIGEITQGRTIRVVMK
jgi:selenide, water dikinase